MKLAVAHDGSDNADYAVELASAMVRSRDDQIVLVTCAAKPEDAVWLRERAARHGGLDCVVLVGNDSSAALVSFARNYAPHLLLIGSSLKGPLERLLVGSTCAEVLAHAPVATLVCRRPSRPAAAPQ